MLPCVTAAAAAAVGTTFEKSWKYILCRRCFISVSRKIKISLCLWDERGWGREGLLVCIQRGSETFFLLMQVCYCLEKLVSLWTSRPLRWHHFEQKLKRRNVTKCANCELTSASPTHPSVKSKISLFFASLLLPSFRLLHQKSHFFPSTRAVVHVNVYWSTTTENSTHTSSFFWLLDEPICLHQCLPPGIDDHKLSSITHTLCRLNIRDMISKL